MDSLGLIDKLSETLQPSAFQEMVIYVARRSPVPLEKGSDVANLDPGMLSNLVSEWWMRTVGVRQPIQIAKAMPAPPPQPQGRILRPGMSLSQQQQQPQQQSNSIFGAQFGSAYQQARSVAVEKQRFMGEPARPDLAVAGYDDVDDGGVQPQQQFTRAGGQVGYQGMSPNDPALRLHKGLNNMDACLRLAQNKLRQRMIQDRALGLQTDLGSGITEEAFESGSVQQRRDAF